MDAYQILGIKPGARKATIKAAYRKLASKYHPDKNKTQAAEELFKLIKEAYEFLMEGESSSGRFGQVAEPPPYRPPPQPPTPTHVQRVELWLTFSEAYAGARAKVRLSGLGVQFYVNVPAGVEHRAVERLLASNTYGQQIWVDCVYHLHDPKNFYEIKNIYGEEVLYCKMEMSAAELIAEKELSLPNIDPHGGYIQVSIPCTQDHNEPIKVGHYGMRRRNLRRGLLYVQPLVYFRPLDQEPFPTISKLKDKVEKLAKSYKYFK